MKILVLNPNTSASMTAEIGAAARAAAAPGTEIHTDQPSFGAAAIDSAAESYLSAVGVMDVVATRLADGSFDAHPAAAVAAIVAEAGRAVNEDGADVICLGCAGMAGVTDAISSSLGVPCVAGVFAAGPDNPRSHWPLSAAVGARR